MKSTKLTLAGKVVVFILFLSVLAGLVYGAIKVGLVDLNKPKNVVKESNQSVKDDIKDNTKTSSTKDSKTNVINISLDEWIGWKSIVDANGNLTTQAGTIFNELGLQVNIHIINDATQSSNALIKGDLDAAGYTINRLAFLQNKFEENNVSIKMPFVTNFSTGGDGIIAKSEIKSVEDLVNAKIGVPRYSEAQTLVWWLLSKSDLTDEQIKKISDNMVMFDTPDDAAKAFFAGQLDAAATWQPYLSQAQETMGAHLLFSTKAANKIILDGIVFREDYIVNNRENVEKFIEGVLRAAEMYKTEFTPIKNSMSLFATETNENIKLMTEDADLADYNTNVELFGGIVQNVFKDMSNIWINIGEKADSSAASNIFDVSILMSLGDKFDTVETKKPKFTEEQRQQAQTIDNTQALLKKSATINFEPNSAKFTDQNEAYTVLDEFVEIAKVLDGAIIQIEGNIADTGSGDSESGRALSLQRAKAVAEYLKMQNIDPSRFVMVGNGVTKPVGDNNTEEGMKLNRRTDIFFKIIE